MLKPEGKEHKKDNKPYISTGLRVYFAIFSSQVSTVMEPADTSLEHETTNRQWEISPRDLSFLSSLSIIHGESSQWWRQSNIWKEAQSAMQDAGTPWPQLEGQMEWTQVLLWNKN